MSIIINILIFMILSDHVFFVNITIITQIAEISNVLSIGLVITITRNTFLRTLHAFRFYSIFYLDTKIKRIAFRAFELP